MFDFIKFKEENQSNMNVLLSKTDNLFLHSNKWTEFQKTLGRSVSQYLIYKDTEIVGYLYIENNYRKLTKYAYSPFNPIVDFKKIEGHIDNFLIDLNQFAKTYLKENNLNVFRFDPFKWDLNLETELTKAGFKRTLAAVGPKYMWEIDLSKTEEELFADMKKVARYNIRSSEKAGIEIFRASEEIKQYEEPQARQNELINEFYKILEETTKRQGFSSFDLNYFQKQAEVLSLGDQCELFLAKYNGQYVSGAWVNSSENTISYTHGGSIPNPEIQKFGASYLLHWTVIKYAKSLGKKYYNMWGVVPDDVLHAPLKGVSDFKKRFGGQMIINIGGFEVGKDTINSTINKLYDLWVYRKDRT
ncbi:MAG: peptidoglycan bridge formation glycyltransferase FemA/FemB family protein [Candidatus Dojkabacteria bacterium]